MRFLILIMGFVVSTAHANEARLMLSRQMCAPHSAIEKVLKEKYKEQSIGMGVTAKGKSLVQVWSSKDGKRWAVTRRYHSGIICFLATGRDWETREFKAIETKS